MTMRPETLALVGQNFGRFTVIEMYRKNRKTYARCRCECGREAHPTICSLKSGKSKSCGCLRLEATSTHGMSGTKFYKAWGSMKIRCTSNRPDYVEYYKSRGITVCSRWQTFDNFYEDMYDAYVTHISTNGEENTTLERIDVNKGYSPDNCKWATKLEQVINRRVHKSNQSGYTGIYYVQETGKWRARGYALYREIPLGNYATKEEAIKARQKFEMERENYYDKPIY